MTYKCVSEFELECFDDDGRPCDRIMRIEIDSLLESSNDDRLIDGENRLINNATQEWIEIPDEILDGYFELVQ